MSFLQIKSKPIVKKTKQIYESKTKHQTLKKKGNCKPFHETVVVVIYHEIASHLAISQNKTNVNCYTAENQNAKHHNYEAGRGVIFSDAVVLFPVRWLSEKIHPIMFFCVGFVENMKESMFMVVVCHETICDGLDLTMKMTVWRLKKCLRSKIKFQDEIDNKERMNIMYFV